jgi:hypothetical protein
VSIGRAVRSPLLFPLREGCIDPELELFTDVARHELVVSEQRVDLIAEEDERESVVSAVVVERRVIGIGHEPSRGSDGVEAMLR